MSEDIRNRHRPTAPVKGADERCQRKVVAEMTLGERIATLRKEKGLSQEALGELVGVSRQAVSKWEADRAIPDVNNCVAMSRVFGISLAVLLELEEEGTSEISVQCNERIAESTEERPETQAGGLAENQTEDLTRDSVIDQTEDLTEAQLRVLGQMIDKYTAAQKKLRRRWRWPLILAGCTLAVGAAWLFQWLEDMNRTIDYLHGEVAGLRSEIISGVSDQIHSMWEEDPYQGQQGGEVSDGTYEIYETHETDEFCEVTE